MKRKCKKSAAEDDADKEGCGCTIIPSEDEIISPYKTKDSRKHTKRNSGSQQEESAFGFCGCAVIIITISIFAWLLS